MLTTDEIISVWQNMPGGSEGWLKTFGFVQFAEAILDADLKKVSNTSASDSQAEGWKEATIAWTVCGSIHEKYAKGKDPFFKTRSRDFEKHEHDARRMALSFTQNGE